MMRTACLGVLAFGCNQAFGIQATRTWDAPIDADVSVDEDLDGVMNAMDDCPGIYNPQQLDRDHDGVGDVCDPHPDIPGDQIVSAEYFSQGLDTWIPDAAQHWSVVNGVVETTGDADATMARLTLMMPAPHPTLEMAFVIRDYGPDKTVENVMEISLGFPGDIGICRLQGNGPGGAVNTVIPILNGRYEPSQSLPEIAERAINTFRYTRDGGGDLCVVNGAPYTGDLGPGSASTTLTGAISVTTQHVAIAYLIVYASP